MVEILTLAVDICLGAMAYRLARANKVDLAAVREQVLCLIGRVDRLEALKRAE